MILGSTLGAFFEIILNITACFVLFKKRTCDSIKAGDFLDLEPILPGMLTRFTYNELKIITEDFSRKLGEGGFGAVYEGTLSNGTKIAVKRLEWSRSCDGVIRNRSKDSRWHSPHQSGKTHWILCRKERETSDL